MTTILENKSGFSNSAIAAIISEQLPSLAQGEWALSIGEHTDHTDETFICVFDVKPVGERANNDNVVVSINPIPEELQGVASTQTPNHRCKWCGLPSWVDPSDQSAPSDYCSETDHGEPDSCEGMVILPPPNQLSREWVELARQEDLAHLDELDVM